MNRIEKRLEELKQENKKAFITYTTAGLPDLQTTAKLIFAQEEAGADILEIFDKDYDVWKGEINREHKQV